MIYIIMIKFIVYVRGNRIMVSHSCLQHEGKSSNLFFSKTEQAHPPLWGGGYCRCRVGYTPRQLSWLEHYSEVIATNVRFILRAKFKYSNYMYLHIPIKRQGWQVLMLCLGRGQGALKQGKNINARQCNWKHNRLMTCRFRFES